MSQKLPIAITAALLGSAWLLATQLQVQRVTAAPSSHKASDGFAQLLGDSRRMLARHFFTKADVYFHSGYYPSMFDQALRHQSGESQTSSGQPGEERCKSDFDGQPLDWIDAFGRNFYPSRHTHLGEGRNGEGQEREILPWLRLSLELSPEDIETYTLASYWLNRLKRPAEAEAVLRDGLVANPGDPELLFELGRTIYAQGKDLPRSRNLWESSWRRWQQLDSAGAKPEPMIAERALASLAELEERSGNLARSLECLVQLKPFSPHPEIIQESIEKLKARLDTSSAAGKAPLN